MRIIHKSELLPIIQSLLPADPIIVEAGAYNGNDTKRLAKAFPAGHIHAFEPVPDIFKLLQESAKDISNISLHPYALSSATGQALMYVSQKPGHPGKPFQAGSLHKPTGRLQWSPIEYPATMMVPTITLDEWAQRYNVDHVDFLWLDVQGHALTIMQASPVVLKNVRTLYLEIEFKPAYEGQPTFEEVITWLNQQGFHEVARDFQDQERWFYGNMLFARH